MSTQAGNRFHIKRAIAARDRADKFLKSHPGSSAAGIVRDLRDIISDMEQALIRCIEATQE